MTALILTFSHEEKELVRAFDRDRDRLQLRGLKSESARGWPLPFWGEGDSEGQLASLIALRKN